LLEVDLQPKDDAFLLTVALSGYPAGKTVLNKLYLVTDKTSPLMATIKDGTFKHPIETIGEIVWEETFTQDPIKTGKKLGRWEIDNGWYKPLEADSKQMENMAVITAPLEFNMLNDATFEGNCQLPKDGEGGLIVKGYSVEQAVYVFFSARRGLVGFVQKMGKVEKWALEPIPFKFAPNVPFHFKVAVNNEVYTLFIDNLPLMKVINSRNFAGIYGIYVNMKAGQPVLWDNLKLTRG